MNWISIKDYPPKNGNQFLVARRLEGPPGVSMAVATWIQAEGSWLANGSLIDDASLRLNWPYWSERPDPPKGY